MRAPGSPQIPTRPAPAAAPASGLPSASRGIGRRASARPLKVAYFSPLPPERSGIADYSALLLPALEKRLDVAVVRARSEEVAARHRRCALPRREQPRGARMDRGCAAAALGARRPARFRPPSPRRRHDHRARRPPRATWTPCSEMPGVVGRLLAHGVVDHLLPPIWEERAAGLSARVARFSDRADGVICHSRYVENGKRGRTATKARSG